MELRCAISALATAAAFRYTAPSFFFGSPATGREHNVMSVNKRLKHSRRPKKSPAEKRRRQAVQKRRLVALGVPQATADRLDPKVVRTMLKRPADVPVAAQ